MDRKLRILNENAHTENKWVDWCIIAFKNIYGYEWQGDNLLLARKNLFYTFVDYYENKFKRIPEKNLQKKIAEIISWNLWQMDGVKFVIPNSCHAESDAQISMFGKTKVLECLGCRNGNIKEHNGIYCKIKNWETNKAVKFINFFEK